MTRAPSLLDLATVANLAKGGLWAGPFLFQRECLIVFSVGVDKCNEVKQFPVALHLPLNSLCVKKKKKKRKMSLYLTDVLLPSLAARLKG